MPRRFWGIMCSCALSLFLAVALPIQVWSASENLLVDELNNEFLTGGNESPASMELLLSDDIDEKTGEASTEIITYDSVTQSVNEETLLDENERYDNIIEAWDGDTEEIELYRDMDGEYEQETNDTVDTANSIRVNTKYNGNLSKSADVDYYRFTLSNAGVITFTFGHDYIDSSSSHWSLRIYNTNDVDKALNTIYYAGNVFNDVNSQGLGLPAGEYIVKIEKYTFYYYSDKPYHFIVNYEESDQWEKEPNDATNTANEISVNKRYNGSLAFDGDKDNYRFTLSKAGVVTVTFGHDYIDSSSNHWSLRIYNTNDMDKALNTIYYAGNVFNDVNSQGLGLPAGEYIVKIEKYTSYYYSDKPYHFIVNYEESDLWEKEPNDSTNTATEIRVNKMYNGSLAYSGDKDNYRFTLSKAGVVTFTFGHDYIDSANSYWRVSIYNTNDMDKVLKTINYAGNVRNDAKDEGISLTPSEYIVRIEDYYYSDKPYHFSVNDPNTVIVINKGDVTGDGLVAMGDVVKLARAVAGNIKLTDEELQAGDVTGDGQIAMGDVVKLARFVAGTIKEL